MNEELHGGGLPRGLVVTIGVGVVLVVGIVGYLLFSAPARTRGKTVLDVARENELENARETLKRVADLNACRNALQQVDAYLANNPKDAPPALDDKGRARLQALLHLKDDELAEITGSKHSVLDAHHLEASFLFRDASESIRLNAAASQQEGSRVARAPVERASAAFNWTLRQVRLTPEQGEPAPPQFVLRRGTGSALERALVFLAVLDGLGSEDGRLHGCLLWVRDEPSKPPRLWACGVLAEGGPDIFLFDPRLGLPLPGPNDAGVATLAAVRKDPALLAQLHVGDQKYDVTPAQVAGAELTLAYTLSAVAPRMAHLQNKLLPPLRVTLAQDPVAETERWSVALKSLGDKPPSVTVLPESVGLLRRFLPTTDGGTDVVQPFDPRVLPAYPLPDGPGVEPMSRRRLYELSLVPWSAFPRILRDPGIFPGGLGRIVRDAFGRPFIRSALEPGQSRDQMLRGDYRNAPVALVEERKTLKMRGEKAQAQGADLVPRVLEWSKEAIQTYGKYLRPRDASQPAAAGEPDLKEVWARAEAPELVLSAALAGPRGAEVTWLLGLCLHEEAERKQARLDLRARTGVTIAAEEKADVQTTWKEAAKWWYLYAEEFPNGPALAAVRRLHARAEAALGNRDAAVALLENTSAPMAPVEKLGCALEARRLKSKGK